MEDNGKLNLFVNVPFCRNKNLFLTEPVFENIPRGIIRDYFKAVNKEIEVVAEDAGDYTVSSVYLTNGYGNLGHSVGWQTTINKIKECFNCSRAEVLLRIDQIGFTQDDLSRFSYVNGSWVVIPMVSCHKEELEAVSCPHSHQDTARACVVLMDSCSHNFDLEVYYGLPGQTKESMVISIEKAAMFFGDHISLLHYGDAESAEAAEIRKAGVQKLNELGFYEYIHGRFSKHNKEISYYRNMDLEYMTLGVGAASDFDGVKIKNTDDLALYMKYSDKFEVICTGA